MRTHYFAPDGIGGVSIRYTLAGATWLNLRFYEGNPYT